MYSLFNEKNTHKMFGPNTCNTKKPSGYQVAHQGYLLMSCPGQML